MLHVCQLRGRRSKKKCGPRLGLIPVQLGDEALLLDARLAEMKQKIGELSPEERSRFHWEDAFNDLSRPE